MCDLLTEGQDRITVLGRKGRQLERNDLERFRADKLRNLTVNLLDKRDGVGARKSQRSGGRLPPGGGSFRPSTAGDPGPPRAGMPDYQ